MKPTTLSLNSSIVVGGFLHKLFEKGPDFRPMIIDVRATSKLKPLIQIEIEENLSMKL